MSKTSQIPGFYKLSPKERVQIVKGFANLTDEEVGILQSTGSLPLDLADRMIENVVGAIPIPLGIAVNFLINGKDYLIPISNLATKRLARAWAMVPKEAVGGEEVVDGIVQAYAFAAADPYRAVTHNKGILNGIIAVVIATCNDHRAVEAGAHVYAAISGHYGPLSIWEKNEKGDLVGSIELPMAVGIIGGATRVHPVARAALKILGVKTATGVERSARGRWVGSKSCGAESAGS
ncbi:MAG: Hydroxymethylglutaryl-coenzyme A reductase [Candidatus Bathyarchaeota archaeon BA1]|nr:MAG: Hydroxymethylglutaryl-coenzyme A reductase [Candidatus Bathyarchaeota archaeon BA1]